MRAGTHLSSKHSKKRRQEDCCEFEGRLNYNKFRSSLDYVAKSCSPTPPKKKVQKEKDRKKDLNYICEVMGFGTIR